jgi:hypothetical protein
MKTSHGAPTICQQPPYSGHQRVATKFVPHTAAKPSRAALSRLLPVGNRSLGVRCFLPLGGGGRILALRAHQSTTPRFAGRSRCGAPREASCTHRPSPPADSYATERTVRVFGPAQGNPEGARGREVGLLMKVERRISTFFEGSRYSFATRHERAPEWFAAL